MQRSKGLQIRMLIHRVITYPLLMPAILGYKLTKNQRCLDVFYCGLDLYGCVSGSIRSMFHGIPKRNLRIARYKGMSIIFPSREDPSFDDVWLREVYYPYLPRHEDIVFDVGAHMGFFTLKVAKQVKEVIAFEPDPQNFKFLLSNIKYNDLSNVKPFNQALGDKDCDVFLKRGYGYGRTRTTESNTGYNVKMKTLDTVVKELGIIPDVIKIDVEGSEIKVLDGAKSTLTRYKPQLIIASYHYSDEWKDIAKILAGIGISCYVYEVPLALQKAREIYVYSKPS